MEVRKIAEKMSKRVLVVYRIPKKVEPYAAALSMAEVEPVLADASMPTSLKGCDGLLLAGGTDVNPVLYSAARNAETEEPDEERDALEWKLLKEALERDLPILGICRGLQIFNVFHHGTLIQHLDSADRHVRLPVDQGELAHEIVIEPNTVLSRIMGQPRVSVNSRHHQAADRVGEGLRVAALDAKDGTIEALERPDRRFAVAVQWHPENQVVSSPIQLKLFTAFAQAL